MLEESKESNSHQAKTLCSSNGNCMLEPVSQRRPCIWVVKAVTVNDSYQYC